MPAKYSADADRISRTSDGPPTIQHKERDAASASVHTNRTCFGRLAPPAAWTEHSVTQPDRLQPADFRHPALGHPVRGGGGRYAFVTGDGQDALRRGENPGCPVLGPVEAEPLQFVRDLDHAAR